MSQFEKRGWRQGSVLPHDLATSLVPDDVEFSHDDLSVVLSQDCDVTCPSLDTEPSFEFAIARKCDGKIDRGLEFGRNPRRLQFAVSGQSYLLSMQDRYVAARDQLSKESPDGSRVIGPDVVRIMAKWLARRYDRAAFPTEFNTRLKHRQKKISKALKGCKAISAIFLLTEFKELPQGIDYRVVVLGALPQKYSDAIVLSEAIDALDKLCLAMSECKGIIVEDWEVKSEAEITLDDIRLLRRWDVDYLSERNDPPNEIAPRE